MKQANHGAAERDMLRQHANREELTERIARVMPEDGREEVLEGLTFNRSSSLLGPVHALAHPCICVIAQGSKEVHLGESRYRYDPFHFLLITAELPLVGHVIGASEEAPYLSLRLDLDSSVVNSVMVEAGHTAPRSPADVRAIDVSPLSESLLDAFVRLVRLLDDPAEIPVLAPLITREIIFRLLKGEQGIRLGHIAPLGGDEHRIARAVKQICESFEQSIPVAKLAEGIGMSVSAFHHRFKTVTGMSPLQFQKHLQLQEARRLMLSEGLDAATAGYRVGYKDASHFSREYKRLFGRPPMRDVKRPRDTRKEGAG